MWRIDIQFGLLGIERVQLKGVLVLTPWSKTFCATQSSWKKFFPQTIRTRKKLVKENFDLLKSFLKEGGGYLEQK